MIEESQEALSRKDWHRTWRPIPDWKNLEFTIITDQGAKRLKRGATFMKHEISELQDEFDLMTPREADSVVKLPWQGKSPERWDIPLLYSTGSRYCQRRWGSFKRIVRRRGLNRRRLDWGDKRKCATSSRVPRCFRSDLPERLSPERLIKWELLSIIQGSRSAEEWQICVRWQWS